MKSPNRPPRPRSLKAKRTLAEGALVKLSQVNPNPRCELYYETPYQLLVSVILSAQTTDKMVNRCMEPLYRAGFTPKIVVDRGQSWLLDRIRSIGLAPTKSKNVVNMSRKLLDQYKGEVPSERRELEALPGVGRKTANVIMGELFGEPTIAVDTHVYRVTMRLGLHKETTPEKAEQSLLKVIDPSWLPKGHHLFILHGRYHCTARRPGCSTCPLWELCPSRMLS